MLHFLNHFTDVLLFVILFSTTRGQAHLAGCADRFEIKADDALVPKGQETVKLLDLHLSKRP